LRSKLKKVFKTTFLKEKSTMDAISFVQEQLAKKTTYPAFKAGDNVIVNYKIAEGDKVRIQAYRGDVIQIKGHGANKTFTVRKISNSIGVERIFPFSSPSIDSIEVLKIGRVRRARLFYLRELVGKKARIKELKKSR
jgi:large subunit ribosomal protein L19